MKKGISILCVLILCAGLFGYSPAQYVYAESIGSIEISSWQDIELIRSNPAGDYVLTADIELTGEFDPIDSFSGVLDGNGHVISGLTITSDDDDSRVAFIGQNDGRIENLGFEGATIVGQAANSGYWASIIASTNNGTISGCYIENSTVTGGYRSAGICVQNKSVIENCYSEADISANAEAGGLVAVNEAGAVIDASYAAGDIYSETRNTGGISAYSYTGSTVSNCAFIEGSIRNEKKENGGRIAGRLNGTPTLENNVADEAILVLGEVVSGYSDDKNGLDFETAYFESAGIYSGQLDFNFSTVWYFDVTDKRPRLRAFQEADYLNTYEIFSENDLEILRQYGNEATNRFVLMNDIQITGSFTPIDSFDGMLDGNGHKISGFEFVANGSEVSAFIRTNNGVIKNLGLASTVVHGETKSDSEKYYSYASGLVGKNSGVIEKCYVTGNISGAHRGAGIAGENNNLIVDCYFIGYVSAREEAGGICALAGAKSGTKNSYVQATVYSKGKNTGGIAAYVYTGTFITDCAVLSGHIDNGDGNIARIAGRVKGTPVFANNYASENALVQTSPVSSDNAGNNQGKTVSNEDTNLDLFGNKLGWDLDAVWKYDETSGVRRPVLAKVDEELSEKFVYSIDTEDIGTVAEGLTYSVISFTDTNFNKQSMSIIKLDYAHNPQYEICVGTKNDVQPPTDEYGNYIKYADAEGHDTIKGIIPEQLMTTETTRNRVVYAGVNGEFYTEQGPEGYMIKDGGEVVNGTRISTAEKEYPFHGFLGVKNSSDTSDPFVIGTYDDDWDNQYQNLYQATGGQYILTKDGEIPYYGDLIECVTDQPDYDQETYYRYKGRHPRTAIGFDGENLYMVVIDGRQDDAAGVYIEELAMVMDYLGCTQSINMDGGGSSTSVIHNLDADTYDVLNSPCNTAAKGVEYEGQYLRSVFSSVLIVDRNDKPSADDPTIPDGPSTDDPVIPGDSGTDSTRTDNPGIYYPVISGSSETVSKTEPSEQVIDIIDDDELAKGQPVPKGDVTEAPETTDEQLEAELNSALGVKQKNTAITVNWGKVTGADGYFIYGGYCSEGDIVRLKDVKSADTLSYKFKKLNGKSLNLKKNFMFRVEAYKLVNGEKEVIAESISMYVAGAKSKTYGNVKTVKAEKEKVVLNPGERIKIKAETIPEEQNKKPLYRNVVSEFRYATDNPEVATVTKNGIILAKGKGACSIWVYARNGRAVKIAVTVK